MHPACHTQISPEQSVLATLWCSAIMDGLISIQDTPAEPDTLAWLSNRLDTGEYSSRLVTTQWINDWHPEEQIVFLESYT